MEKPKICVPMTGCVFNKIKEEAELAFLKKPDLVEWRSDYYNNIETDIIYALNSITELLCGIPLIFTLRSHTEGGAVHLSQDTRKKIILQAIKSTLINYIDIERANGESFINPILESAHQHNVKVIISSHNFDNTPPASKIIALLEESAFFGADIVKIAVMPENYNDVLTLLQAVNEYKNKSNSRPVIAISMGKMGVISRISAGLFGSVVTFASLASSSAPGQIPVDELKAAMELIY